MRQRLRQLARPLRDTRVRGIAIALLASTLAALVLSVLLLQQTSAQRDLRAVLERQHDALLALDFASYLAVNATTPTLARRQPFAALTRLRSELDAAFAPAGVDADRRGRWQAQQPLLAALTDLAEVFAAARAQQSLLEEQLPLMQADYAAIAERLGGAADRSGLAGQIERQRRLLAELHVAALAAADGRADAAQTAALTEGVAALQAGLTGWLEEGGAGAGALPRAVRLSGRLEALQDAAALALPALFYLADSGEALRQGRTVAEQLAERLPAMAAEVEAQLQNEASSSLLMLGFIVTSAIALVLLAALLLVMTLRLQRLLALSRENDRQNEQVILRMLDEIGDLAKGDLTVHVSVTEHITGAIADAINYAIAALRDLAHTIERAGHGVGEAAEDAAGHAEELAAVIERQIARLQEADRTVESMLDTAEEVAAKAGDSSAIARRAVQLADRGSESVRRTIRGMGVIREQIQDTAKRIKRLGEGSQEIGEFVELIEDIAEQTNILALNAAIQASSAGEAGRGFAVVADEVQRLAERSSRAAGQIDALVRTIQADTGEAMASMERSTAGVVAGANIAEEAGTALEQIERVSSEISAQVRAMGEAARRQADQGTQMRSELRAMREGGEETAAGTRKTAAAIGRLSILADALLGSVRGFKLPAAGGRS